MYLEFAIIPDDSRWCLGILWRFVVVGGELSSSKIQLPSSEYAGMNAKLEYLMNYYAIHVPYSIRDHTYSPPFSVEIAFI